MLLTALIAVCGLIGLLFFIVATRRLRRGRLMAGGVHTLVGLCFALAALASGLLGFSLLTYERLTREQLALEVQFARLGERHYRATLTYPSNRVEVFELHGDEWQVDARLIKWHGLANIIGFDTVYRLERIGGRYRDIASERSAPRSVHVLNAPDRIDVWELTGRLKGWAPWIDALYGSATYMPMGDGASYQVMVSQTGLLARPLNQAGRQAVGGWQ